MTARKGTMRGRRVNGGLNQVPKSIAAWFARERSFSFMAASQPHRSRLREYWGAWSAEHPGAVPPPNFELFASNGEQHLSSATA